MGNSKEEFAAFAEGFIGPNIPAAARIVRFRILWLNDRDTTTLYVRDVEVEQTPPDISASDVHIELLSTEGNTIRFAVKGIGVNYEVPIDADNSNPNASKSIKASLNDVEIIGEKDIEIDTLGTRITLYEGFRPEPATLWRAINNCVLVKRQFNEKTGYFSIELMFNNLPSPKETSIMRGTLVLRNLAATIVNRKAGKRAVSTTQPIPIPIEIPLGKSAGSDKK
jgi:hypothetical protein